MTYATWRSETAFFLGFCRCCGIDIALEREPARGAQRVSGTAGRSLRVELPPMGEGDADAQSMLRYAAGDARAFDALYERHRSALWRFIRRSLPDAAATDD